jgi:hypothetical protein
MTAGGPLVSVVIPVYTHVELVDRAINSALGQTHRKIEVIVVDDGSGEDLSFLERPGVKVVRQTNLGVSAARNRGVAESSGDLVAFLDADDYWVPTKIECQVAALESHVGLVHCHYAEVDLSGRLVHVPPHGSRGHIATGIFLHKKSIGGGGSSILLRREVFDEVGGFTSDLSTSADWDLKIRIAERYFIEYVPSLLAFYTLHDGNMHQNLELATHDMLLALDRALARDPDRYTMHRRQGFGTVHMILAGSYAYQGNIGEAARHATIAIRIYPPSAKRLVGYPTRSLRRMLRRVV